MAREVKPVELRMIDEPKAPDQEDVVRLRGIDDKSAPVVRVVAEPVDTRPAVDARLVEPSRAFHDGRSQEPDVDTLLAAPIAAETEESAWDQPKGHREPVPWGWFALVGLLLGGAIVWAAFRLQEGNVVVQEVRQSAVETLQEEERLDDEARDSIQSIEAAAVQFCKAETTEQLLKIVRHRERVAPLIEDYYKMQPIKRGNRIKMKLIQPLPNIDEGMFWVVSMEVDGATRAFLVETQPDGTAKIDWESTVCHQPMPWDEFATERSGGTSLPFRVYVEPDTLFSHEFADESRWLCFRLTAKDAEETLFGYARVDSPVAAELTNLVNQSGGRKVPCILRLGLPVGMKSRKGVVIEALASPRWIYVESPDAGP